MNRELKDNPVYIIIGTTEEVGQTEIGGPFTSSFYKSIVNVFCDKQRAEEFVEHQRLKKPIRKNFSGIKYFRGGYYDMEIEEHSIK